jgi:hypothetical protein
MDAWRTCAPARPTRAAARQASILVAPKQKGKKKTAEKKTGPTNTPDHLSYGDAAAAGAGPRSARSLPDKPCITDAAGVQQQPALAGTPTSTTIESLDSLTLPASSLFSAEIVGTLTLDRGQDYAFFCQMGDFDLGWSTPTL